MSLAQVQQTFPDGEADGHLNRLPDAPLPPGTLFYRVLQAVIGHPWPVLITFTLEGDRLKAAEFQFPRKVDAKTGNMTPLNKSDGKNIHDRLYAFLVKVYGVPQYDDKNANQRGRKDALRWETGWADIRMASCLSTSRRLGSTAG